jgi:integrase
MGKLTKLQVDALSKKPGLHSDGGGLYLNVSPLSDKRPRTANACSWVFRYMIAKRARTMGLGPYPEITLAEARAAAAEARKCKAHGQDPLALREEFKRATTAAAARSKTFKECAAAYISDHRAGWKNAKTGDQWEASLVAYAYPSIGPVAVDAIDTDLVMCILRADVGHKDGQAEGPFWEVRPETASRVRTRISAILDWAETKGLREPSKNPARWRGHLENLLPPRSKVRAVVSHAALPVSDMPTFLAASRVRVGMASRALEFAILTAARTTEVREAPWSEIDLAKAVWTVPAARMKGGRDHRVPLSTQAVAILQGLRSGGDGQGFVFEGGQRGHALSNNALLAALARMGRGDLTAHGFRSTFRDWCAETGVPRDLAEASLAHAISNKTEAAYLKSDVLERRRAVMQAWGDYCDGRSAVHPGST